jgi:hypothetical protein
MLRLAAADPIAGITLRNQKPGDATGQDHDPETVDPTWTPHLSTMDAKKALIPEKNPGQSLDQMCAARDSNPEPAD